MCMAAPDAEARVSPIRGCRRVCVRMGDNAGMSTAIRMVGFDADDTLWKSEDYYRAAEAEFRRIVGGYIDLSDKEALHRAISYSRK